MRSGSSAQMSVAFRKARKARLVATGFFRAKSRSLIGMATAVVKRHSNTIPGTMEALVELPGVGRKTANVVLGHALGVPGLPVDRHVLRVANRIGIAHGDDPAVVEQQLGAAMPPKDWTRTSDTIISTAAICKRDAVRPCAYAPIEFSARESGPRSTRCFEEERR